MPAVFEVAVCEIVSLFTHVTVVPTDTVNGFGEYAVVVSVRAPATMLTLAPVGVGVGLVTVGGE